MVIHPQEKLYDFGDKRHYCCCLSRIFLSQFVILNICDYQENQKFINNIIISDRCEKSSVISMFLIKFACWILECS